MANATRTDAAFPGFVGRHIGPGQSELGAMLAELGLESLDQLCEQVVPSDILLSPTQALEGLPAPCDEREALDELAVIAKGNQVNQCVDFVVDFTKISATMKENISSMSEQIQAVSTSSNSVAQVVAEPILLLMCTRIYSTTRVRYK